MADQPAADSSAPYADLTPDRILAAVESVGLTPDGRLLALNSFENRVYQVGLDEAEPIVVKFYRPGRWSDEAIAEEHAFIAELSERDIPVAAPLAAGSDGQTLHRYGDYRFCLYPRVGGRPPEPDAADDLEWLGRLVARIHAVGAERAFRHRPSLDFADAGQRAIDTVANSTAPPPDVLGRYRDVAQRLRERLAGAFAELPDVAQIRLHGDFHLGNILWTPHGPLCLDLDDARTGPAMQDLWMLLSGDRERRQRQLGNLLEGYRQFYGFDPRELRLIEALRGLRLLRYAGWIAGRWHDPAFAHSFPWFAEPAWWYDHVQALAEQTEALDEPPLELPR